MMKMTNFELYQSPYTWRYGTDEMRQIWSEANKRRLWRKLWLALAETQANYGLVNQNQIDDLAAHSQDIDIPRALEIEAEVQHDLMAELKTFAEQCPLGGGSLHLGATSMDIEDNADALRLKQSMRLILDKTRQLLTVWVEKIEEWADFPILAFTHIQPAEPSTLGYRFATYAQDLLDDWLILGQIHAATKGKGFKGAVGTSSAYIDLIGEDHYQAFETSLSEKLGLPFFTVTNQTYPRKQEYTILSALAGLGSSLSKFAFDLRILQSPMFGELSEPFGNKQVGSSAMPFKRNPVQSEKINSLARLLAQFPRTAWDNASNSLLERTLDDSANRRSVLPEAFLIADELLKGAIRIVSEIRVDKSAIQHNLDTYSPFSATERVLMAVAKAGANRQDMHERLRTHSLAAWKTIQTGLANPLIESIAQDPAFQFYVAEDEIRRLMHDDRHIGNAPEKARELANLIKHNIQARDQSLLGRFNQAQV
jgi:adenylosuccinate lyase